MTVRPGRKKSKNPSYFSHEFVITNHGDIVSLVAMVIVMGLLYKGTHSVASKFIFIQHNVTDEDHPKNAPLYTVGRTDACLVFFYTLICIVAHAVLQEYLFDRVAKKLNLTKVRLGKFNESAHLTCFYALSVAWGIYNVMNEELIVNLSSLWEDYPHILMPFWTKMFLLIQELIPARIFTATIFSLGITFGYVAGFSIWNVLFIPVRMASIILPVLVLHYGLGKQSVDMIDFATGNFNTKLIRMAIMAFMFITQAYMVWNFITFHQRSRRDKPGKSIGWFGKSSSNSSADANGTKRKEKKKPKRDDEELSDAVVVDSNSDQSQSRDIRQRKVNNKIRVQ